MILLLLCTSDSMVMCGTLVLKQIKNSVQVNCLHSTKKQICGRIKSANKITVLQLINFPFQEPSIC